MEESIVVFDNGADRWTARTLETLRDGDGRRLGRRGGGRRRVEEREEEEEEGRKGRVRDG
jgi:hypothetical protein